jgi:hypothetical protein
MNALADLRTRRDPAGAAWLDALRWVAVLPVAMLASGTANAVAAALFSWSDVLRAPITAFVAAAVFLIAGSIVAPRFKVQTAVVLVALNVLVMSFLVVTWLLGVQLSWATVTTSAEMPLWLSSLATLCTILGWAYALHWIRKDAARTDRERAAK